MHIFVLIHAGIDKDRWLLPIRKVFQTGFCLTYDAAFSLRKQQSPVFVRKEMLFGFLFEEEGVGGGSNNMGEKTSGPRKQRI